MKKLILALCIISFFFSCKQDKKSGLETKTINSSVSGQQLDCVEPPNWWIGMKNPKLQLLVHDHNIGDYINHQMGIKSFDFLDPFYGSQIG